MLLPHLHLGSRLTLVGGKGGVGKTTTAAALALELADAGEEVLVISTDPAHSLGDALQVPLRGEPVAVPGVARLTAMEVDAESERRRFLASHRAAILRLIERGTYLDAADADGIVDLALPGMDELAALFRLLDLARESRRVVVDTAPTGHTLRLLELPRVARGWVAALQAMEDKHRAVASALTGAYRADEAAELLQGLDADLAGLDALLSDAERTRFILITNPSPVVLAETRRLAERLDARGIALGGIVVNRAAAGTEAEEAAGMVRVGRLERDPVGLEGLRRFSAVVGDAPVGAVAQGGAWALELDGSLEPPLDRTLYLVGGKGGVGKSTTAAALALLLARRREDRVLLISTDPAGSLADVLGVAVGTRAARVAGGTLWAQQVDAAEAWAAFRAEYRDRVERLFGSLLSGGLSAGADRAVVERLVDLAPPGIDELVALLEVIDAVEDRTYDALVLDTAPTGHLLRLLELPELALDWSHALLRLLLKYREVVGLGELAERILALTRSLRSLRERLADPGSTWALLVALPEALSVAETARLRQRLGALGVPAGALLINRLLRAGGGPRPDAEGPARALLTAAGRLPVAAAPDCGDGPVGERLLLEFAGSWRRVTARTTEPEG